MRGVYTGIRAISSATSGDMLELIPAANTVIELLRAEVTADQETAEQLDFLLAKSSTAGSGTPTTITPQKSEEGDQAAAATLQHTPSSAATLVTTYNDRKWVPNAAGVYMLVQPEERVYCGGGTNDKSIVIRLNSTPANAINSVVLLRWREIG